ncbi:hypothetical protein SS50377_21385 [Spironucleus salmonicida]|uniref:Uncharacterized protein n=1 Tax=Spironucleus salmonicida TaxID=348837 RepID=A0A9P8S0M1_9EUKA|nr:hypothetical protein SS50377_21385 [Spironucleus salmonicida]
MKKYQKNQITSMSQPSSNQQQIMNHYQQILKLTLNINSQVIRYVAKLNKQDQLIKIKKQQKYCLNNLNNRFIIMPLMYLKLIKTIVSIQQLIRQKHANLDHTISIIFTIQI